MTPQPHRQVAPIRKQYTVAVDFDGVLHSYSTPWSGAASCPDPPVPGAIDWLNEIVAKFDVVILTTRGDQEGGNEAVGAWLREHGYTGPDLRVTSQKVPALVYVDDRAWRFEGNNFPTADEIHRAVPWNKVRPNRQVAPWWPVACPRCGEATETQADLQAHLQHRHAVAKAEAARESVSAIRAAKAEVRP